MKYVSWHCNYLPIQHYLWEKTDESHFVSELTPIICISYRPYDPIKFNKSYNEVNRCQTKQYIHTFDSQVTCRKWWCDLFHWWNGDNDKKYNVNDFRTFIILIKITIHSKINLWHNIFDISVYSIYKCKIIKCWNETRDQGKINECYTRNK